MKVKQLKKNTIRAIFLNEGAIRELVYEGFLERGKALFCLAKSSKACYDINFDINKKTLLCVVHKNIFPKGTFVDFEEIEKLTVGEKETIASSSTRYSSLFYKEGIYRKDCPVIGKHLEKNELRAIFLDEAGILEGDGMIFRKNSLLFFESQVVYILLSMSSLFIIPVLGISTWSLCFIPLLIMTIINPAFFREYIE